VCHPYTSTAGNCGGDCFYIAASYVKWIESAGGRVVPIKYNATNDEVDTIMSSVNGILFPGGDASIPDTANYIFESVIQLNKNGDYFPLWGTCLGFEWLLMAVGGDDVLSSYDAENISLPLTFTNDASSSRLYYEATDSLISILATENVTMNNHMYGGSPDLFEGSSDIGSFYTILSTNEDRSGKTFVSSMESKNYPIYGIQFHPEKNNFEWGTYPNGLPYEVINHSPDAVIISQYFGNVFMREARQNFHTFAAPELEDDALIYNYQPTKTGPDFMQEYYFTSFNFP